METFLEKLKKRSTDIASDLEELLAKKSGSRAAEKELAGFPVISPSGDRYWTELDMEGKKLQNKLYGEYSKFSSLVSVLLRDQPKKMIAEFKEAHKKVLEVIEQNGRTWHQDMRLAFEETNAELQKQISLLSSLYTSDKPTIFVPDTNSLISNPDIESWELNNGEFEIMLTPTVLSELDQLKVLHRNEMVRRKAETVVRKIKEYQRRGNLNNGVPLISGRSTISSVAVEPKVEESLPWFDPSNKDDKILASTIEIMRNHLNSAVIIVTGDINLQNKANNSELPFIEPTIATS